MIGTIELERLEIDCIVGILPFERVTEQKIFVDVSMELDFAPPSASEDVADTIDYTVVSREITDLVRERKYQLIETMAVECVDLVLSRHTTVDRAAIAVHKPAAVPQAKDTVVRFGRSR
jgi:7,8-dihydroneopterin aldolase/epimerase/oxygenase